jgi:hypothetical protein
MQELLRSVIEYTYGQRCKTEIHTAEPLVPDPRPFEVEIAIANLKRNRSPGSDQIPA